MKTVLIERTYFVTVIHGVFCLDACVIYKWETLSVVTLEWSETMGTYQHSRHYSVHAISAEATKMITTITDKLQQVLNAAAPVVSDTRKFDRGLSTLLHDKLH